ncbi:uncharacterized protein LOC112028796 [Quercus suber]
MGETALFSIAQAMIMTKGLMGRCLNQETTIGRLREKAKVTEGDLLDLKAWKITHEKKLGMAETARDEAVQMVENLKKALVDKDNEVRHAKEEAVREYRDSSEVIAELSVVYNDGFDDALRQVRRLYPDLDLSAVSVSAPEPSTAQPAQTEDTDALFDEDGVVREAPLDHTAVDSKVKDAGDRPDVEEDGA